MNYRSNDCSVILIKRVRNKGNMMKKKRKSQYPNLCICVKISLIYARLQKRQISTLKIYTRCPFEVKCPLRLNWQTNGQNNYRIDAIWLEESFPEITFPPERFLMDIWIIENLQYKENLDALWMSNVPQGIIDRRTDK